MKRSALARGKPLARGKALSRSTRVAPVNRERRARLFDRNFGERGEPVREMTCLAQTAVERLESSNEFAKWVNSPGYKLSLTDEAARVAVELDERGLP